MTTAANSFLPGGFGKHDPIGHWSLIYTDADYDVLGALHDRKQANRTAAGLPVTGPAPYQPRHAACICTDFCTEDASNPCAYCRALDIYQPCPVIGFGCGLGRDAERDCDCCSDAQFAAASS